MRKAPILLIVCWLIFSFPAQAASTECSEAKTWYHKGLALSNNSLEEIACYQKALELCPGYAQVHIQLGNVYKARQEWNSAIEELQLACTQNDLAEPHTSLGEIYRLQGQYDLAVQEFQTALDITPEDKRALSSLEYIYRMSGRYDDEGDNPSLVPSLIFGREPGFTLPSGGTILDWQVQSLQRKQYENQGEQTINIWKLLIGIRYGLTNNLTLGIIPKLFWKKAYILRPVGSAGEQQEYQPSVYGLGDTMILVKYCLWYRKKASLAAALNISFPTGDEKKTARYAGIDFPISLGSGKYEFMPSLAFSNGLGNLGYLHANFHYFFHRTSEPRYKDPGDEIGYNMGFCHPISLLGTSYLFSMPITGLVAQIELNGLYTAKARMNENEEESDVIKPGGNTLFLSPGVKLVFYPDLQLEAGVQFPISIPQEEPWIKEPIFHIGFTKYIF